MFLKKIMTTAVAILALGAAVLAGGGLAGGQTEGTVKPPVGNDVKAPVAEKPVEPSAKQAKRDADVAWGQEVGGLQAGVAVGPGDIREYKLGDRVAFEVKLRNVGKVAVTVTYCVPHEHAPAITDSQGRQVQVTMPPIVLYYAVPTERVVKPGETMTLFKNEVALGAEVLEPRKGPDAPVSTPTIRVGPGAYQIAIGGMVRSHPKLSTGSVEFVVKKDEPGAEPRGEVAWGKEVNGVQIGIQLGKHRVYQVGETVTLVLRLRNNGKEEVPFRDDAEYFEKNPPHVTGADGKAVTIRARSIFGFIRGRSVAPGKEVDLIQLQLALRPAADREKNAAWTLYGTGKFQVQYPVEGVVGEARLGAPGTTLTTGKLELEVQEAPAEKPLAPEKRPG